MNEDTPREYKSHGRGIFLAGVAVASGVLCVGVAQVPQPMRGHLIGYLLIFFTLGLIVLRFMNHYSKMAQLRFMARQQGKPDPSVAYTLGWQDPKRVGEGIKVVTLEGKKGGRFRL